MNIINQDQEDVFSSNLPLTIDQINQSSWSGFTVIEGRAVVAEIFESENKGRFHCRIIGESVSKTKSPVIPEVVGIQMDSLLSNFNCKSSDFKWKPDSHKKSLSSNDEIVYFLSAGPFIKIGKASGTPDSRVLQLQTGCPFPITVMKIISGGYEAERKLHKKFMHLNSYGEWFHSSPELIDFIASLDEKVTA